MEISDDHHDPAGSSTLAVFHNSNQSPLDLSFSLVEQPMAHTDFSGDGDVKPASQSSHDDTCVDRCAGLGLYNAPSFFHHRGPPASAHPRGRHSLAHVEFPYFRPSSFAMGFADLSPSQSIKQFHPLSLRPDSAVPQHNTMTFSHEDQLLTMDEDSQSIATSCHSGSQCDATQCCGGTSCANEDTACSDNACSVINPAGGVVVTSEEANAAAALTSFCGSEQQQPSFSHFTPQDFSQVNFNTTSADDSHIFSNMFCHDTEVQGYIKQHLLEEHGKTKSCIRPCLIDSQLTFSECHFGPFFYGGFPQQQATLSAPAPNLGAYGHNYDHAVRNAEKSECHAKIDNPDAFIEHFNVEHRPFMLDEEWPTSMLLEMHNTESTAQYTQISSASPNAAEHSSSTSLQSLASPDTAMSSVQEASVTTPVSTDTSRDSSHAPNFQGSSARLHQRPANECLWHDNTHDTVCRMVFNNANDLYDHVIHAHIKTLKRGPNGFVCAWENCCRNGDGKDGFPQRSKIERHLQTHVEYKPHTCKTCGQKFSAKQALDQHVLIHMAEKPLQCEWPGCDKRFRQQSALTMHKRTHTGDKPLSCKVCGKTFSESSNLSKHKRIHEPKRFVCEHPDCEKRFRRLDQLRKHRKQHEPDSG